MCQQRKAKRKKEATTADRNQPPKKKEKTKPCHHGDKGTSYMPTHVLKYVNKIKDRSCSNLFAFPFI